MYFLKHIPQSLKVHKVFFFVCLVSLWEDQKAYPAKPQSTQSIFFLCVLSVFVGRSKSVSHKASKYTKYFFFVCLVPSWEKPQKYISHRFMLTCFFLIILLYLCLFCWSYSQNPNLPLLAFENIISVRRFSEMKKLVSELGIISSLSLPSLPLSTINLLFSIRILMVSFSWSV